MFKIILIQNLYLDFMKRLRNLTGIKLGYSI